MVCRRQPTQVRDWPFRESLVPGRGWVLNVPTTQEVEPEQTKVNPLALWNFKPAEVQPPVNWDDAAPF